MSEKGMDVTTSVGRIVWGHPTKQRAKTHRSGPQKGQPQRDQNGQPIMEISFGVAFPKAEFGANIWPTMAAEIATGYPQSIPPRFAFKYVDGDGPDPDGKPYSEKEGYAGCYVLAYTQRINEMFAPPTIFQYNDAAKRYDQLPADAIKCGDYVAVGTNFKVHIATGSDDTPSIYVNPRGIELVGYGTAIASSSGVDPSTMFGGQARALPVGASATPIQQPGVPGMPGIMPAPVAPMMAPPGGMMPGAAPMTAPGGMPGMMPAPVAPVMAPPPPPPVQPAGPARPIDPSHIANPGTPNEMWWNGAAWVPAPIAAPPAPMLPPPAPDFVQNAGMMPGAAPMMPGMMPGAAPMMPGMMPGR